MLSLYARRRLINNFNLTISLLAMAVRAVLAGAGSSGPVAQGFHGLSLTMFTQMTPPPGSQGGLLNAIAGSLMMADRPP